MELQNRIYMIDVLFFMQENWRNEAKSIDKSSLYLQKIGAGFTFFQTWALGSSATLMSYYVTVATKSPYQQGSISMGESSKMEEIPALCAVSRLMNGLKPSVLNHKWTNVKKIMSN